MAEDVATKEFVRLELRVATADLRTEFGKDLHREMGSLRSEVGKDVAAFRLEIGKDIGDLRAELHKELREQSRRIVGFMVTLVVGAGAAVSLVQQVFS